MAASLLPGAAGELAQRDTRRLAPSPRFPGGPKMPGRKRDHAAIFFGERLKAPRTSAEVSARKANSRAT